MKLHRIVPGIYWLAITQLLIVGAMSTSSSSAQADTLTASEATKAELPEGKQTTLGLYATAVEAYAAWEAAPDEVMILDVRTPEEFMFVGHPEMAWNVPVFVQTLDWDEEKGRFSMAPVPDFVANVEKIAGPSDTIYVTCRSGGRSAMAVDMLAEAGFTNVFTITDGVEGGKVKDENSPDFGHRTVDGWKNSDLPWTYELDPERMVVPAK